MKSVLINIPQELHAALKQKAKASGKSVTAMILAAAKKVIEEELQELYANPPLMPSLNHSKGVYTQYELQTAMNIVNLLADTRLATFEELKKEIKPKIESVLIRMLQGCIQDGYIKYENGYFMFIKKPT